MVVVLMHIISENDYVCRNQPISRGTSLAKVKV